MLSNNNNNADFANITAANANKLSNTNNSQGLNSFKDNNNTNNLQGAAYNKDINMKTNAGAPSFTSNYNNLNKNADENDDEISLFDNKTYQKYSKGDGVSDVHSAAKRIGEGVGLDSTSAPNLDSANSIIGGPLCKDIINI